MAQWDDGYVTDVAYTTNFYREMTPSWLAMTCLLLGQRPPDLATPFRYADLGCGNGMTALAIAATCPHADVWGFDFNPAHIEFARWLAARAGLNNIRFLETSFADLAAMNEDTLPTFDFVAAHGVLSWISVENRRHLMSVIGNRLKAGGLAYISYNVTTGWAATLPMRRLMQMLSAANPERTDVAVPAVLDYIERVKEAGSVYFQVNPLVDQRLQEIKRQDPRYTAHEYLNQDWYPLMFSEVAADMAQIKCHYIGSATLTENIESICVPAGLVPLLTETRDPILRETLRDIGCAQSFRRDVYRKGLAPMPAPEQQAMMDDLTLIGLGHTAAADNITFAVPIGTVTGRPEIYQPLLQLLDSGALTVRKIAATPSLASLPLVEIMQAFTLLASAGYAHPMLPASVIAEGTHTARSFNQVIAQANANALDLTRLAAPALGSAIGGDVLETLVVGLLLEGKPANLDMLTTEVMQRLAISGRHVQKDGQPVTEPVLALQIASEAIQTILERRVPVLRRVGVLPA